MRANLGSMTQSFPTKEGGRNQMCLESVLLRGATCKTSQKWPFTSQICNATYVSFDWMEYRDAPYWPEVSEPCPCPRLLSHQD